MKLYQTIDGTLIGFYKEKGGAVQCTSYRDIYELQMVKKTKMEWEQGPSTYENIWAGEYCDIETRICYPAGWVEIEVVGEWKQVEKTWWEWEEVWVGREPIYEYIDPVYVQAYEVLELTEAPADRPDIEDLITIRNTETGEVLKTTATYIGLGEQIDENEYVVP